MIATTTSRATLAILNKAVWIAGTIAGLLLVGLGGKAMLDYRAASSLNADSLAMEAQQKKLAATPRSKAAPQSTLPHGLDALRAIQAAVSASAQRHECQLVEFRAGTQIAPYTPRYQRNPPEGDWSQAEAHFTLSGSLRNIMLTLHGLDNLTFPIEVDTINMSRDAINRDGSTDLSVQVELRTISNGAAK